MHGVPPGGKIQLLHMAEEEDDKEFEGTGGGALEQSRGAIRPILKDFN